VAPGAAPRPRPCPCSNDRPVSRHRCDLLGYRGQARARRHDDLFVGSYFLLLPHLLRLRTPPYDNHVDQMFWPCANDGPVVRPRVGGKGYAVYGQSVENRLT
jgi:hypothetical protein